MNYSYVVTSITYSIGQIALGLLLHPYQTMQSLVRDRVFVWMSLLPTLFLALVTILWRFMIVPAVRIFFSCKTSAFFGCDVLIFVSNWLTFFCFYWQILLMYLLFRFNTIFRSDR